jgi:hypothetical protein
MESLAPQNQYKNIDVRVPRYRYARIPLNNLSSASVTLNATSTTLCEWKLPASSCYNLSRSFIAYQWPLAGAGGLYGVTFEDGCDWRTAYFGNGSGLGICDLQYADIVVNTVRPIKTKFTDFLSYDQLNEFYPCNQLNTSNIFPWSIDGLTVGTANNSTTNYTEPQHLFIGSAVNTAVNVSRYFPLNSFKDTFFEMDKDITFGQDMYMRLWTNYSQRMGFWTNSPNNPNANASITPITNAITMSNVYLYLAVEENLDIRNSLLTALSSGKITMSIPYSYVYRFSVAGGSSSASVTLTLTKSYGRAVKKITYVPYNALEYTQYAYDHNNTNGVKVNQIQSTMDGRPLTDYILNCYNPYSTVNPTNVGWANPVNFADDWREARKYLQGSCINSYPQYASMWFYIDSWGVLPGESHCVYPGDENINDGFDLIASGDHVYSISALSSALTAGTNNCSGSGMINYLIVLFNRTLEIQPDGIYLSP